MIIIINVLLFKIDFKTLTSTILLMNNLQKEDYIMLINKKLKSKNKKDLIDIVKIICKKETITLKYSSCEKNIQDLSVLQLKNCAEEYLEKCTIKELINISNTFISKIHNIEKCAICHEFMGQQKNSLECGHWCHFKCIRKATSSLGKKENTCPICRKKIEIPALNSYYNIPLLRSDLFETINS